MRKLILIIFVSFISFIVNGQVYQEMPQYGYRANRMAFDSTLQIPTTCGVPTLKSNVLKKAAIAFDSCNNKIYKYNPKTLAWSEISGSGTTPNLQQVTDSGNTTTKPISLISDRGILSLYNNMNEDSGIAIHMIDTTNLLKSESYYSTAAIELNDKILEESFLITTNNIQNLLYQKQGFGFSALRFNTSSAYYNMPFGINNDTIATLRNVRSGGTTIDTTSLSNRINLKLNISDTSNKWVNNIYRKSGKDSIFYQIGSTEYKIKDSIGIGNGRFGNDTATIVMAKIHNDAGIQLTNGMVVRWSSSGTNSDAPSVRLANNKHDSSSANTLGFVSGTIAVNDTGWVILSGKIEKLNTSAFSNGDIIYLDSINGQWTKTKPVAPYHMVYLGVVIKANAGNGSIFVKAQNGYELDEIHDVQISNKINNQILAYSDTQKVWKNRNIYSIVDTSSLSNRINLKLNTSDSTVYYSKYRSDTSRNNIYSAINGKQATITLTTTGTTGAATFSSNTLNIPNYSNNDALVAQAYGLLGSTIKGINITLPNYAVMTGTANALASGTVRFIAYYLPNAQTITGVKWWSSANASYTANNYNGVGLYSYSGGTLTLVASSTNDGNIWSNAASNSMGSKAFSSTYSAASGIYFIGLLYSSSAQTTAPSLGSGGVMTQTNMGSADFTNSAKLSSSLLSQTALPSTQAMSGTVVGTVSLGVWLY